MTPPADARAAEEAFEAALAGRPGSADARTLTAFTDALRAEATAPGRPNAALAELLATGLPADASRTTVGHPARRSRKRPRMILSTLVVKFAAAGTVAKAAVAGGAVALALTGAATAQVLPGQEEDAAVVTGDVDGVASADDDTTGGPVGDGGTGDLADDGAGSPVAADTGVDGATGDGAVGGTDSDTDSGVDPGVWAEGPESLRADWGSFGEWVSAGARAGLVRGEVVSCFARVGTPNGPTLTECQDAAGAPVGVEGETGAQPPAVPARGTDADVVQRTVEPTRAPTGTGPSGGTNGPVEGQGNGHAGAGDANTGGNGNGNGNAGGNGGGRR